MRKPKTWGTVRGLPFSVACLVLLTAFSAHSQEQTVNHLSTLEVQQAADSTTIVVNGSAPPTFTVFKLTNPTRLFVDISNADISKIEGPIEVENGVISQITPLQFTDELVRIGRVVIGLEGDALYNVKAEGNRLLITVNGTPKTQSVAADSPAAKARLAAAQARAEEAEKRARDAESRLAEAESKARDAETRAESEIAQAKAQADAAETRAQAIADRANRLAEEAEQAKTAAESAQSDLRKEADARAAELRAQAKAAEDAASAARTEAEVAQKNATAQEAANQARIAAAEAKADAAEAALQATQKQSAADNQAATAESQQAAADAQQAQQRAAEVQAIADAALEKAEALEKQAEDAASRADVIGNELQQARTRLAELEAKLNAAEAKAQSAETEKKTAEARAADAERKAKDATSRIAQAEADAAAARETADDAQSRIAAAEAKLVAAEESARQAESNAESAKAQIAQAEARARRAEVNALKAAEDARLDASSANARATAAEAEAKRLAEEARVARADAENAKANRRAAADQKAEAALARAEAARADAESARLAASGSVQAADAKREAAEARAREAIARAEAAESKLEISEAERQQKAQELDRLTQAAEAAEQRANTAQASLTNLNTELELAQGRIHQAEQRATQARSALADAERERNQAKTDASRAAADAALATQRITTARSEAEAASERARAAEQRAIAAEQAAKDAQSQAQDLRKRSQNQDSDVAARNAEQRARMAEAEAKAQRLEAERARLAQRLGQLETERMTSQAQMRDMKSELERLDESVKTAQSQNDQKNTELLAAQRRAKDAELKAEEANTARIEAAKANSIALKQMKAIEAQIAEAETAKQNDEVKRLSIELANAQQAESQLRLSLKENQRALDRAVKDAEGSQAELARLRAQQEEMAAAKSVPAPAPAAPAPAAPVVVLPPPPSVTAIPGAPTTVLPPPPPRVRTRVTDVRFDENADGSKVTVTLEGNADYVVRKDGDRTRILEIRRALIDPSQERNLDTSEFPGAVKLVSSFQAEPPGDRVHVVVTLSENVADEVLLNGSRLEWSFERPTRVVPTVATLPPPPAWAPNTEVQFEQSKAAVYTGLGQSIVTRTDDDAPRPVRRKQYSGHRINIDIKDGDIHNVLRLLAKEGGVNIVTSDEVAGTVTMHLRQVPWDQALEIILRTKGLGMVNEGQIIRVAPAESIAKERETELKVQEVQEKLKPLEVKLITVNHATAADLIPRLESVLSARGKAQFDERTNTVIVRDVDEYLDAAVDMISRLDTQTPQVLIETRIVEVNEVNVQQLGIQWGIDSSWSAATGNPTGLRFPSSVGISGGADDQQSGTEGVSSNPNFVVNLPASAGLGSGGALGMTFGSIDSTFNLNVRLSALENRGSVKIVSSPKITTLDNKKARISQGVSIPISQVSASGIQTIFFDAVLSLEVIPHVTQDGNIYLNLNAQNNTPDFQNVGARGDPTILKKEAQTELLLKDGDTTVIGGIYTSNNGFNHSEVPFFARIPILGAMFRNHQESERRTELLIFVTPRIVNRAASKVRTLP